MRIAALILGIVLSIVAGLQSIALFAVSSVGDSLDEMPIRRTRPALGRSGRSQRS